MLRQSRVAIAVLSVLWFVLICALPLAHVTGLRNTLVVCACITTFVVFGVKELAREPVVAWLAALIAWATLSITWSASQAITWSKLQTDLILPVASFCAAFLFCRNSKHVNVLFAALLLATVVLALLSLVNWMPTTAPAAIFGITRVTQSVALNRPMPIWYPGVGDASMFVAVAFGPLIALSLGAPKFRFACGAIAITSLLTIALATSNRNVLAAMPLAAVCFIACLWLVPSGWNTPMVVRWRGSKRRVLPFVVVGTAIALLAAAFLVELASREIYRRAGDALPPGSSAAALSADDARPAAWRAYIVRGASHLWIGAGYGRPLPALEYRLHDDPTFSSLDPALRTHAHNFLLDLWLQLGLVGIAIFFGFLVTLIRRSLKQARTGSEFLYPACGVVVTIFFVMVRNLTDDFLVYAGAEFFWIVLGMLSGWRADWRSTEIRVTQSGEATI